MNDPDNNEVQMSAEDLAAVLHALALSPTVRVTPIDVTGRRVWIKRYDLEPTSWAKRLHSIMSPMLYPAFLRGAAPAFGAGGVARECGKIEAFRAAGFRTPRILHRAGALLVLSDASPVLTTAMADMTHADRQALLIAIFETLGRVHRAGLVHGRPHLRDMSLKDGQICFFDFEEAPEEAMPLADAQARDLWLLMLPLFDWAPDAATRLMCLNAWLDTAPASAVAALIRFLRFCRPFTALAGVVPSSLRGNDLERFLASARFLAASISDMDSAIAASANRPAAQWKNS